MQWPMPAEAMNEAEAGGLLEPRKSQANMAIKQDSVSINE